MLSVSAIDRQGQMALNIGKAFINARRVNSAKFNLDMRRISCRLRLSLLPEIGQRQGRNLRGGYGGCDTPKIRIIWIGGANHLDWRANHLDWQGNQRF